MLGQFGGVFLQAAGIDLFERPRHLLVEADAAGGDVLLVQGGAEEGVGEAVSAPCPHCRPFFDDGNSLGLFDGRQQFIFGQRRRPSAARPAGTRGR